MPLPQDVKVLPRDNEPLAQALLRGNPAKPPPPWSKNPNEPTYSEVEYFSKFVPGASYPIAQFEPQPGSNGTKFQFVPDGQGFKTTNIDGAQLRDALALLRAVKYKDKLDLDGRVLLIQRLYGKTATNFEVDDLPPAQPNPQRRTPEQIEHLAREWNKASAVIQAYRMTHLKTAQNRGASVGADELAAVFPDLNNSTQVTANSTLALDSTSQQFVNGLANAGIVIPDAPPSAAAPNLVAAGVVGGQTPVDGTDANSGLQQRAAVASRTAPVRTSH